MNGRKIAAGFAIGLGVIVLCYGAFGVFMGDDDGLAMITIGLVATISGTLLLNTGAKDKSD